ncbi:MAG: hypothetical protein IKD94_02305 [Erysipelotrichaceae bacterium]|nr:hypothetical protein [Erysipelotrichaceae bacterium]
MNEVKGRFFNAVLVAISIPIFSSQLEKAREATDQANIRSAYAEVMAAALTDTAATHDSTITNVTRTGTSSPYTWTATVTLKQSQDGWQGPADEIGGIDISGETPTAGGTCTISFTEGDANADISFS